MRSNRSPLPESAFSEWGARDREGLVLADRRAMLKASLAGFAGLSLPQLLAAESAMNADGKATRRHKRMILLWMAGGPSHVDTWDPKPEAPSGYRGPFGTIETSLTGVRICEHLPKQAALMDRLTILRSVDCVKSNHQPNMVMQTANREAEPRLSREGHLYPAIGSIVSKFASPIDPALPGYAAINVIDRTHFAWGGYLGQQFDPFDATGMGKRLRLPKGLAVDRLQERRSLADQLDQARRALDDSSAMSALDHFSQQAVSLVADKARSAVFDAEQEPPEVRARYGDHAWGKYCLLARRLVESGVRFVTVDLSNHHSSGTWDTHGDNIPPYGGITKGLKPLLPIFDHVFHALITDLEERGLLDDVLVLAMGEFGRTPKIGTQDSTDGRDHWPVVLSATLAGGGLRHGQVIGSTDRDGGQIKERPITPADLAATIYHYFGVPLDATYADFRGRPRLIVEEGGQTIRELQGGNA